MLSIARKRCGTGVFVMCKGSGCDSLSPRACPGREIALKSNRERSKDISELAVELEEMLRRMSVEQLEQVLELPFEAEQDGAEIAKRLAEGELARRRLQ
jgi:hypothetical protein